jgi:hypothetical protein
MIVGFQEINMVSELGTLKSGTEDFGTRIALIKEGFWGSLDRYFRIGSA